MKIGTTLSVWCLVGVAACLRIVPPLSRVFTGQGVRFAGADAWYHMRLADVLARNFPHPVQFDPYIIYPAGVALDKTWPALFDWLLALPVILVSRLAPGGNCADMAAACVPALLGALVVWPVYSIGRQLVGSKGGVLAAAIIAIIPGEFFGRSILGFTDHHVAEVLFSTIAMACVMLVATHCVKTHDEESRVDCRSHYAGIWTLMAGFWLGCYLAVWMGAPLFVAILAVWLLVKTLAMGRDACRICLLMAVILAVAWAVAWMLLAGAVMYQSLLPRVMAAAIFGCLSLSVCAWVTGTVFWRTGIFWVGVGILAVAVATGWVMAGNGLISDVLRELRVFFGQDQTILETQPLLFPNGQFSVHCAWDGFTTGFFIVLPALAFLAHSVWRHRRPVELFVLLWSVVILTATLISRRFAYYLAVNVAVLTSWLAVRFIDWVNHRYVASGGAARWRAIAVRVAAWGMVILVVLVPNAQRAWGVAARAAFVPSMAWVDTLKWMRKNTPEPFLRMDAYYELFPRPAPGQCFDYGPDAYGVMAWWDYGHWIIRIARRLPVSTPFQWGMKTAARFLAAQDERTADSVMDEVKARYVIVDRETVLTKLHAVAAAVGRKEEEGFALYRFPGPDGLKEVVLFHAPFYRSMAARLFFFDGQQVTPSNVFVVSFKTEGAGQDVRRIVTDFRRFDSYGQARAFLSAHPESNYEIVSDNPNISPVPLKELKQYLLRYVAMEKCREGAVPAIKVFEYHPGNI